MESSIKLLILSTLKYNKGIQLNVCCMFCFQQHCQLQLLNRTCNQSTIQAAGALMLTKSPKLLNVKHMLTLFALEHLNLPSSDYLVINVTFKWDVCMYLLDAKTVEN